jgi:hypothetical protein
VLRVTKTIVTSMLQYPPPLLRKSMLTEGTKARGGVKEKGTKARRKALWPAER